jgi:hypothetical protein
MKYLMSVSPPPLPRERLREAVAKVFVEEEGAIMQTLAEEWKQEMREEVMLEVTRKLEPLMREEVREEARQEGRWEEVLTLALRALSNRLGSIAASTEKRVRELSITQLEDLVIASANFRTNKDLQDWLRAQSRAGKE